MNIGRLRHLATIEKRTLTQSPTGAPIETWSEYSPAWIGIESGGREFWAARQVNAELTHVVRARWIAGVTPTMRVNFGDRLFDIRAVINVDDRNAEMRLMCVEKIDA